MTIDITPAVRQTAGVGRYARELARALVARGANDYRLFAADRRGSDRYAREPGDPGGPDPAAPSVRYSVLPARWHTVLWHRLRIPLPAELWAGRSDVYHATDFLAPPLLWARPVITVHDLSFLRLPERADPDLRRHLSAAVPRAARRAAHVLADSENTRRDVVALLGVPESRVTVAYPGVSSTFRRVTDAAALEAVRARYRLDRPFVLGVGTIEPRKEWPVLVAAFERSGLAGHALIVAGRRGWLDAGVDAAVASARGDVRLLGFVPDADLPALYSLADAFAFPSACEGFGLPPLEALACGAPTVVSDGPCLPEIVGDAALVTPVGDVPALAEALRRLVTDACLRADLAVRGPARAARFTWDGCAATVEAVYAEVGADGRS